MDASLPLMGNIAHSGEPDRGRPGSDARGSLRPVSHPSATVFRSLSQANTLSSVIDRSSSVSRPAFCSEA